MRRLGLILSVLFSMCTMGGLYAQNMDSSEGDRQALMDLFNSTNGENWKNQKGWSASSMDLSKDIWGVGVEEIGGELRVVHMDLQRGTKTPPEPFSDPEDPWPGNNVEGELPNSIGNLSEIRYLNLKQNFFTGSVPASMANWTKAERILLSGHTREPKRGRYNHVSAGSVFGQSKRELTSNKFSGDLPEIFENMSNLEVFEAYRLDDDGSPRFTGNIPSNWPQSLKILMFHGNDFTGNIPSGLTDVSGLEVLYLTRNKLSGNLPSAAGNWSNMTHLTLSRNDFSGSIPDGWVGFNSLQMLTMSFNNLSGSLPSFLLDGRNNWIEGFRLEFNNFEGEIPQNVNPSDYPHWNVFSLSYNNFSGPIPDWIPNLRWIQLNLEHNSFSGDLPAGFHDSDSRVWRRLRNLKLQGNNLTGPIPQANPGPKIWVYYLENNNFAGTFSSEFGETTTTRTMRVRVGNNNLSGNVPANIADIANLSELYLDGNRFSSSDLQDIKSALPGSVDYRDGNQDPGKDDGSGDTGDGSDSEPDPSVGTPEPLSPANGSNSVSLTPTFEWSDVGADAYQLNIITDGEVGVTIDADVTAYTFKDSLAPGSAYEWKVRGVTGGVEGEWSGVWDFTTEENADSDSVSVIPAPELITPAHTSENVSQVPSFAWGDVGAEYYILHVSSTEYQMDVSVKGTEYTLTDSLLAGGSYEWRVRGVDGETQGEWSKLWQFKTEQSNDEKVAVLPAPGQLAPSNDGKTSQTPTFKWAAVDGADYYILHSNRINPAEMVIVENVTGTTYSPEKSLEAGTYHWRVKAVADTVEGEWSKIWEFSTENNQEITGTTDPEGIPLQTGLNQNYPNPFNPSTQVEYTLSELQSVNLKVYDMAGRQVAVLVEGVKQAGRHVTTFNAGNLASGIYFYRLITNDKVLTKKMTLLK